MPTTTPSPYCQANGDEPLRMYFLCLYNLSAIQKGIQSLHAAVDYMMKFSDDMLAKKWATIDKTVILLDVGGTVEMSQAGSDITRFVGGKVAGFQEPDLSHLITSLAFIVPESVYSIDVTPDFARAVANKSLEPSLQARGEFAVWLRQFYMAR